MSLISGFYGANIFFLHSQNDSHRSRHMWYFLLTVETKDYNVMIDDKNCLDQLVKNYITVCKNVKKIIIEKKWLQSSFIFRLFML